MEETPLILASMNGNLTEVRYLIEEANVDVDQQCNFWFNDISTQHKRHRPTITGSALHAAVLAGQLEVVYYLVHCCDLNINAQTEALFEDDLYGGSTALHLAVLHYNQIAIQKEIVTCLIENGADWTIVNDMGEQCWELAFNVELAKLLIQFGVGLDSSRNEKSFNIAHMWAKESLCKFADEVVSLAIEKGININEPDVDGFTPLMIAAIGKHGLSNLKVFGMIFDQKVQPISRCDRIIALELLGATYISSNRSDTEYLTTGFEYLKAAMELRFNFESEPPIPKPPTSLTEEAKIAFKNTCEVQTMEELESVAGDKHSLKIQAHLIRIRILSLKHSETMCCLARYAILILDLEPQTSLYYTHLILKNFDFQSSKIPWIDDYCAKLLALTVVAITRVSSGAVADENTRAFNNAMPILRQLVNLLDSESNPHKVSFILHRIVNLVHVMVDDKPLTSQESLELKSCLQQAVRLQKRDTEGFDLLLLACSESHMRLAVITELSNRVVRPQIVFYERPVSAKTISIFIEVSSDLDSVTNSGETGLHVLAYNNDPRRCTSSIRMLYEAGVHLDQTNLEGKTMIDILHDWENQNELSIIIDGISQLPPLKCLCARTVRLFPSLLNEIPPNLAKFVMRH